MSKYLVLGASSFSGRSFCRWLKSASSGADTIIELSRPTYDLNVNRDEIIGKIFAERPDYIVNFAALNTADGSWRFAQDYYQTNVLALTDIVDSLANGSLGNERPFAKWVQISTPEVYGTAQDVALSEDAPYRPSTPYAISRAAFDLHLQALHRTYGFPVCFARSANVYGDGQQPHRIIPKTVLKILRNEKLMLQGDGVSMRSFMHIFDAASAIKAIAELGKLGEVYHTSTVQLVTIRELVGMICEIMGANFNRVVTPCGGRPGSDATYMLDTRKIRAQLGWADRIKLRDGLPATVEWYKLHADNYIGLNLEHHHKP